MIEHCFNCKKNWPDKKKVVFFDLWTKHIISFGRHFCSDSCEDAWYNREFGTAEYCTGRTIIDMSEIFKQLIPYYSD